MTWKMRLRAFESLENRHLLTGLTFNSTMAAGPDVDGAHEIEVVDFDMDGDLDVVSLATPLGAADKAILLHENIGDGVFARSKRIVTVDDSARGLAVLAGSAPGDVWSGPRVQCRKLFADSEFASGTRK